MRKKMVRLSNLELSTIKKAQSLVMKEGTNKIKCKCGWMPIVNNDFSLGNIVHIGLQCLMHLVNNPKCHK